MNNIIEIGHLCKSFGDVQAVVGQCLGAKEGVLVALRGGIGAGR